MKPRKTISKRILLWPCVSLLLLVAMLTEAQMRVKPADAEPHMLRCKAAIEAFPYDISSASGMWYGADVKQPDAATQILHPNVILSRKYLQPGGPFAMDDAAVDLLIVDCKDAKDLQGHYPPNCYPAQGMLLVDKQVRTWQLKDLTIHGMEYHFTLQDAMLGDETVVYNFFVTPHVPSAVVSHLELDGAIIPDIDGVYRSAEDYQRRFFGAAEFQILTKASVSREQLDQAFVELLEPNVKMIKTLMNR